VKPEDEYAKALSNGSLSSSEFEFNRQQGTVFIHKKAGNKNSGKMSTLKVPGTVSGTATVLLVTFYARSLFIFCM
jgi:hypothetical protein